MTPLQIVFLIVAALTLAAAGQVVSAKRIMHAALWLVLTLLGIAVLFVTLEASFFAVVQVIVYIGAIAILIIFAVMLTRREYQVDGVPLNKNAWMAGLVSLGMAGGLIAALSSWQGFNASRPALDTAVASEVNQIGELGRLLVSPDGYAIPFEVASVLLIGALIGAIYLANEQKR